MKCSPADNLLRRLPLTASALLVHPLPPMFRKANIRRRQERGQLTLLVKDWLLHLRGSHEFRFGGCRLSARTGGLLDAAAAWEGRLPEFLAAINLEIVLSFGLGLKKDMVFMQASPHPFAFLFRCEGELGFDGNLHFSHPARPHLLIRSETG